MPTASEVQLGGDACGLKEQALGEAGGGGAAGELGPGGGRVSSKVPCPRVSCLGLAGCG